MGSERVMQRILFVDDEQRILDGIRRALRDMADRWECQWATSVKHALEVLDACEIDLVVTDISMPEQSGFALLEEIAGSSTRRRTAVLVLTGRADADLKRRALDLGAIDLISKPVQTEDLVARIRSALRIVERERQLEVLNATLESQVQARTRDLESSRTDILICLAMAGECRDEDTGHHLIRVAHYSRCLAEKMCLAKSEVEMIHKASPLHDIGKIGVADSILRKPGPLDDEERRAMQAHCWIGHRILSVPPPMVSAFLMAPPNECRCINPLLAAAAEIALNHHERWDGLGYPRQLAGESIPLPARIVAIADAYDALTTERSYKRPFSHDETISRLVSDSSKHFDPNVARALQSCESAFWHIHRRWTDVSARGRGRYHPC